VTSQFWWWVARASGMVAGVLIALTLIWGLLLTTKVIPRKGMPAWLTDMHRMLGGLSVFFLGAHLVSLFLDSYAHFAWAELFVPFQSAYRPGAVAWGIGAFWLLAVVESTSLLQRSMPRRVWRVLHYVSYPVAVMVALHAMTAGTDSTNPALRLVTFTLVVVLTALTALRVLRARRKASRASTQAPVPASVGPRQGASAASPWQMVDSLGAPATTVRRPASDPRTEVR